MQHKQITVLEPTSPLHSLSSHLLGEEHEKGRCAGFEREFPSASLPLVNAIHSDAYGWPPLLLSRAKKWRLTSSYIYAGDGGHCRDFHGNA